MKAKIKPKKSNKVDLADIDGKKIKIDVVKALIKEIENSKFDNFNIYQAANPNYICDYIIIAVGQSSRHLLSVAEKIRQLCKNELNVKVKVDISSPHWIVIDLNFCMAHLMTQTRYEKYEFNDLMQEIGKQITL